MGESDITKWCNRLIKLGFIVLFGVVPLLLTPWNYELFEYNKMMAVYGIASVVVTSWIVKSLAQKEFRIAKTPLDIPIVLFVGSQLTSAIFSIDPHVSWLGYYSRFNGGMWSIISYVLLYYAFLSNLDVFSSHRDELGIPGLAPRSGAGMNQESWKKTKNQKNSVFSIQYSVFNLFKIALITATLVAVYGVLERLGIDKHLWVQDVQSRVFSTLGQPNWLAAYLVALFPLAAGFAFRTQNQELKSQQGKKFFTWSLSSVFWILVSILFFLVLLFTRSRSGLLGFIVADILFWLFIVMPDLIRHPSDAKLNTRFRLGGRNDTKIAALLHVVFVAILFINGTGSPALDTWITWTGLKTKITNITKTTPPPREATPSAVTAGPALEVGGTESGTIRKYVWQGAINAWNSSLKTKLIGTGTETFAFAFYEFRPVGHNLTSEWDFLYNKAHNEYLNYLATTGIFGLGSYLLFIGTFIWWFVKVHSSQFTVDRKKISSVNSELIAVNFALFAGWISILVTNFFGFSVVILQVFLFLLPAFIFASSSQQFNNITIKQLRAPAWTIWLPIVGGLYILLKLGSFWYADTLYARGYRLIRGGLVGQAIPNLTGATSINRAEPVYHDELGGAYATLAAAAFEGSNASQAAQLANLAIEENAKALATSPRNVNFYKTKTKIFYTLSSLEPAFNAKAIEALEQAIPLSPNDPKIYYNLAILVGREGNADKAVEYLQKAKTLKPNYRDAYYALWVFYTELKKPTDAKAIIEEYLTHVDPNDKEFLERRK